MPANKWNEALAKLASLVKVHKVDLVAIGNGTASRETDKLAAELIAKHPELKLTKVMVSEAGASVYSASAYAAQENCPAWTSPCAARSRSRDACRTHWRSS